MYSHCCHARSTQTQRAEEWVPQVSLIASYLKLPFSAEPSFSLLLALPVHNAGQHFPTKQNSPCPHLTDISGVLSTNFSSVQPGSRFYSCSRHSPFVHSRKLKSFFQCIPIMTMTYYYCCIIAQRIRAGTVGVFGEQPSVPKPDPSWSVLTVTVFSRVFLLSDFF